MRAFVAVFPPPEVSKSLLGAARGLAVSGEVRWVRPENVHLTLKFLGDVPEDDLPRVAEALTPVCGRHEWFEAGPSGFGAFPSTRRARVLWAGIGEGSEHLRALAEDVDASLEPLGFGREDRAYTPHLTLGRVRGRPVVLEAAEIPLDFPSFAVRRVELVQSVPGRAGSTYSTLEAWRLSEGGDQGPDSHDDE